MDLCVNLCRVCPGKAMQRAKIGLVFQTTGFGVAKTHLPLTSIILLGVSK